MGQIFFNGITAQEKQVGDIVLTMQKDMGENYIQIPTYDEIDIRLHQDNISEECYSLLPKYPQGCVKDGTINVVNLKRCGTEIVSSNYETDVKESYLQRVNDIDYFYSGVCAISTIVGGSSGDKLERFIILPEYDNQNKNTAYYFDFAVHTPSRTDLELNNDPFFLIKRVQKITETNSINIASHIITNGMMITAEVGKSRINNNKNAYVAYISYFIDFNNAIVYPTVLLMKRKYSNTNGDSNTYVYGAIKQIVEDYLFYDENITSNLNQAERNTDIIPLLNNKNIREEYDTLKNYIRCDLTNYNPYVNFYRDKQGTKFENIMSKLRNYDFMTIEKNTGSQDTTMILGASIVFNYSKWQDLISNPNVEITVDNLFEYMTYASHQGTNKTQGSIIEYVTWYDETLDKKVMIPKQGSATTAYKLENKGSVTIVTNVSDKSKRALVYKQIYTIPTYGAYENNWKFIYDMAQDVCYTLYRPYSNLTFTLSGIGSVLIPGLTYLKTVSIPNLFEGDGAINFGSGSTSKTPIYINSSHFYTDGIGQYGYAYADRFPCHLDWIFSYHFPCLGFEYSYNGTDINAFMKIR